VVDETIYGGVRRGVIGNSRLGGSNCSRALVFGRSVRPEP
jgi:hypothetical protein